MSISDEPTASSSPPAAPKSAESIERAKSAIQSLSQILGSLPDHLSSSEDPALALLNDPTVASVVSHHLHQKISGSGDDNLCRWFYDTFQSTDPSLQLAVLRFLPIVGGLYLSRCTARRHGQPLAGFEAVLLALYARETMARDGKPLTIDLPNLSAPSPYHEAKAASLKSNKNAEEQTVATAVISAALEPHGTVRSTKRARIVGVALELYYDNISNMPVESKIEFCHFASAWAGHYARSGKGERNENEEEKKEEESNSNEIENGEKKEEESGDSKAEDHKEEESDRNEGRIPLPWELFLPTLRIVGHCLLGHTASEELNSAAMAAAKGLYERAMHDMNPQALLASRSLMRLGIMGPDVIAEPSLPSVYTEVSASEPAEITA